MSNIELTAVFEQCDDGGFIAYIEEIPGINSQGDTIEEARENLSDAINLVFEERRSNTNLVKKNGVKKFITQTLHFSL
jgi:predicted RNase H-like HicB family nuclease